MEFEFDARKSRSNLAKHGIDFRDAQELWNDPDLIEVPARTTDETRFLIVGTISDVYWSAVVTYRSNRVRIISVRRSRREEVALHEG